MAGSFVAGIALSGSVSLAAAPGGTATHRPSPSGPTPEKESALSWAFAPVSSLHQNEAPGSFIRIIRDPRSRLNAPAIFAHPEKFRPERSRWDRVNLGYQSGTVWLFLGLHNDTAAAFSGVVEVENAFLENVRVIGRRLGHDDQVFSGGSLNRRENAVFPRTTVSLAPGESIRLLLRVSSGTPSRIPLTIRSKEDFERWDRLRDLIVAFGYGLLCALALYNLILSALLRQLAYLYYSGLILLTALFLSGLDGLFLFILPLKYGFYHLHLTLLSAHVGLMFALLFTDAFLHDTPVPTWRRRALKVALAIEALQVICIPIDAHAMNKVANVVPQLVSMLVVTVAALRARDGYNPARIFLATFVLVPVCTLIWALVSRGYAPANLFTINVVKLGLALQAVLFAMALAHRVIAAEIRLNRDLGLEIEASTHLLRREIEQHKSTEMRLEQAREEAELAARTKSDFLANMSHEIRTPLNGILGAAQLIEQTPLGEEQSKYTRMIQTGAQNMLGIINDILDFSRIEAGGLTLLPFNCDVRAAIDEVLELAQPALERQNNVMKLELDEEFPRLVYMDGLRFRQILINLVGNAVKFTDRGRIFITGSVQSRSARGMELLLSVADTGIGIRPEQLELIFEAFTQADSSATRFHGGTGLGLAITKRLVALMGGRIEAYSAPGFGAAFTFVIQVGYPEAVGENAPTGPTKMSLDATFAQRHPLRILVAEDNTANQILALTILDKLGYQADRAGNGREALEAAAAIPYDLILMDLQMPVLDGRDATRAIRGLAWPHSDPAIIAFSADVVSESQSEALQAGMNDFLPKPVSFESLMHMLMKWSEERAAKRAKGDNPSAARASTAENTKT